VLTLAPPLFQIRKVAVERPESATFSRTEQIGGGLSGGEAIDRLTMQPQTTGYCADCESLSQRLVDFGIASVRSLL